MINYSITIMSTTPGTAKSKITETKAYGVAQYSEKIDINDFAKHLTSHGCVYKKGDIVAVLTHAVECLREQMLEGKRVELGALGTFQAHLKTRGAVTADAFSAANIEEVNIVWTPGKDFQNLRKEATFQLVPNRNAQAGAIEVIKNQETIKGLE